MKNRLQCIPFFMVTMVGVLQAQQTSTWQKIQQEIFDRNCISCHSEGTSFARQSGLVLTQDVAYSSLVGAPPKNGAAATDLLLRVSPAGGFGGLQQSFIWEKIDASNQNHFYNDHPHYGQLMPLGLPYLTNGELAFIKNWILAGAPAAGIVADAALLNDTTRYAPPEFKVLPPPTSGMQFHLGPFEVWPAQVFDREFLYYEPYPTNEDLYITRYEISMRPGSHHFILFNYPKDKATPAPRVYRDLRNQQGVLDWNVALQLFDLFPFYAFVGTQTPYANYYFPEGVALRLPAGSGFDLNSHSVNRTGQAQIGEVYVNLYTVERSEIEHVAEYSSFGNIDINIPPNSVTTISKVDSFPETRHLLAMYTHAHEHMLEFSVTHVGGPRDGELLYWTNDWAHPPILEFDPPLTMNAGERVKLTTTYKNTTNRTIGFGPLSSDEMQFLFYTYFTGQITSVEDNEPVAVTFGLEQNFPNPFNPTTEIRFSLAVEANVSLKIYDLLGHELATLLNGKKSAGSHKVSFDGATLASGIYFYRLMTSDGLQQTKKMVLVR
jgi:hypothetical protein